MVEKKEDAEDLEERKGVEKLDDANEPDTTIKYAAVFSRGIKNKSRTCSFAFWLY